MQRSLVGVLLFASAVGGCAGRARSVSNLVTSGQRRLSAGASHTCAVRDGTVACWGSNVDGQLGDGDTVDRSEPVMVMGVSNALAVSAGSYHACALTRDASAWCWGWDSYGQVAVTPTAAVVIAERVALAEVRALATGGYHSCALLTDGHGRCWGQNQLGQLGDGAELDAESPVSVFSLPASDVIAAGGRHTCAVVHDGFHDGSVQCWGANDAGELGDGTQRAHSFPNPVLGLEHAVLVAVGFTHSCALREDHGVACWGANDHGQLGDAGQSGSGSAVPVEIAGMRATSIAAGYNHTCAIVAGGTVACWGSNESGQLGDGSTTDHAKPSAVSGLHGVIDIAAGSFHTCAESDDHVVSCWGSNDAGQLGDGTTTPHFLPSAVRW